MGKTDNREDEAQKNKVHKTLRDKLRKKRMELKKHKKQKSQKKKQYNAEQKKKQFFEKSQKKKRDDGIKQHKLVKHLEVFVDIYEDDVEDFYDIFKTLDEGGLIDISDVSDPKMQKCIKKIFKYLPLKKKKMEYKKREKEGSKIKLEPILREILSKVIENYLQNGTDQERQIKSQEESSSGEQMVDENYEKQKKQKKKKKKNKNKPLQVNEEQPDPKFLQNKQLRQYEDLKLYGKNVEKPAEQMILGPSIPEEHRQMLAKMFQQQLQQGIPQQYEQKEQQARRNAENDEFDRIFSMASGRKKTQPPKPSIEDVPAHLMAQGSAKLGQRHQFDAEQLEEYNKIHRPKKLIQQHQQMMKLGKYAQGDKKQRKPFDRQRDIVYGRSRQNMNNGVFFDFKDRMTKPKSSNNFL